MTRRQFLQKSSTAFAALTAASYIPTTFAAEKIRRVGLIGAGWYGKSDLWRLVQVEPVEIISICDPDKHMLEEAVTIASQRQKSKKAPPTYGDYRVLLKEQKPDIVLVGSPDHWHALHMIAAVESGADVYCQKPISRDVLEREAMLAAARKHKRVVQIGTQRKSTPPPGKSELAPLRAGIERHFAMPDFANELLLEMQEHAIVNAPPRSCSSPGLWEQRLDFAGSVLPDRARQ